MCYINRIGLGLLYKQNFGKIVFRYFVIRKSMW